MNLHIYIPLVVLEIIGSEMKKGKYWILDQDHQKRYFDDIEEARWYVTMYMKGLAKIHSDDS